MPSMVCVTTYLGRYTCKTCSLYLVLSRYATLDRRSFGGLKCSSPFKRLVTTAERGSGKQVGVAQGRAGDPIGDLVGSAELFVNIVNSSLVLSPTHPLFVLPSFRFAHIGLGTYLVTTVSVCKPPSSRVMLPAASCQLPAPLDLAYRQLGSD